MFEYFKGKSPHKVKPIKRVISARKKNHNIMHNVSEPEILKRKISTKHEKGFMMISIYSNCQFVHWMKLS